MDGAVAYYDREAVFHPEDAVPMRQLAERLLSGDLLSGFVLIPWDRQSFGIFPAAQVQEWKRSPCIGVWLDDPYPMYWVQVRLPFDGEMLACHQPMGVDEACKSVAELLPQVSMLADEQRDRPNRFDG